MYTSKGVQIQIVTMASKCIEIFQKLLKYICFVVLGKNDYNKLTATYRDYFSRVVFMFIFVTSGMYSRNYVSSKEPPQLIDCNMSFLRPMIHRIHRGNKRHSKPFVLVCRHAHSQSVLRSSILHEYVVQF